MNFLIENDIHVEFLDLFLIKRQKQRHFHFFYYQELFFHLRSSVIHARGWALA